MTFEKSLIEAGLNALRATLHDFTIEAEQTHSSSIFDRIDIKATCNGVKIMVRVSPTVLTDAATNQTICDYIATKIRKKHREYSRD